MPRILVADDNSNIQKMVTLALKDIGIDVVAVPNGEAAVRKLADGSLDLVMADIFMPVRSGYEVCEYIKQDPRYSHLPVVLLVGAFDPLDEREAQRVGADGILKKPFVPPDPLINMVKNLLAKTVGERLVPVTVPAAAAEAQVITPEAAAPPKRVAENFPPPVAEFSDAPFEEFGPAVGTLDFGDHENPIAFSNLLEAPTADDQDLVVTSHRDPSLGEPLWSHPPAAAAETETGNEEPSDEEALRDHTWGSHSTTLPLAAESTSLPTIADETDSIAETADGDEVGIPSLAEPGHEIEAGIGAEDLPSIRLPNAGCDHKDILEISSLSEIETSASHPALTPESPLFAYEQSLLERAKVFDESSKPQHADIAPEFHSPVPVEPTEISLAPEHYALSDNAPAAELHEIAAHDIESNQARHPDVAIRSQDLDPATYRELAGAEPEPKPTGFHAWMATVASIFSPTEVAPAHSEAPSTADSTSQPEISEAESVPASRAAEEPAPEHSQIAEPPESEGSSYRNGQPEHVALSVEASMERSIEQAVDQSINQSIEPFAQAIPSTEWPPVFEPKTSEPSSFGAEAVTAFHEISAPSAPAGEPEPVTNGATVAEPEPAVAASEVSLTAADSALSGSRMQSPEMVEAMVTRIVERMQPKVFDVVTREILRPLVEALVRREMNKS